MTRIRIAAIAALGALTISATGCAVTPPGGAAPTPEPRPSTPTLIAAPEPSDAGPSAGTPSAAAPSAGGKPPAGDPVASLRPGFLAYYAAVNQVLQAGGQGAPTQAMKDTMAGAQLEYWTKQAADYRTRGLKQTGDLKVETFLPGEVDKAAGTASIDFCVNASATKVTDAAGKVIAPADPAKRALGASANLVWSGGRWRVTEVVGETPIATCP